MAEIHIITDTTIQQTFSHFQLAEMAWEGGADVVQYREKRFDPEKDLEELSALARYASREGKTLVINDFVQIALQAGASGVHVGKQDLKADLARELMGPGATIGATVHDLEELEALRGLEINYIGVGPVFGTSSKDTGLPDLGLKGLCAICEASPFPVIGIGGIELSNASSVIDAGAAGVAILSGFCTAPNPQAYVEELRKILD